jgi:diacylglycerol kinase (ATP)
VLAVISPANWNRMVEVEELLRQVFPTAQLEAPSSLETMEATVRGSKGEADIVLTMGGDGTLHRALQWIDLETQTLGLIPGGTGNDLARFLGYPDDLHGRIAHLMTLSPRAIDLGLMGGVRETPVRYHTCGGVGIDAMTLSVRGQSELLRRNYKLAFLWVLLKLKPMTARITAGDKQLEGRYSWILAMNNRDIGGGVQIAPLADLEDGLLDLVAVADLPKLEMISLMPQATNGQHVNHPGVTYQQATLISCEFNEPVTMAAIDGELYDCNTTAISFTLQERALSILR